MAPGSVLRKWSAAFPPHRTPLDLVRHGRPRVCASRVERNREHKPAVISFPDGHPTHTRLLEQMRKVPPLDFPDFILVHNLSVPSLVPY
jgi:hypothetical protein